jgi:hypothetical protein
MCNIKAEDFEKSGVNFNIHTDKEHNVKDYLMYVYMLQKKAEKEITGLENYIIGKIETNDVTWLPLTQSLSLRRSQENEKKFSS